MFKFFIILSCFIFGQKGHSSEITNVTTPPCGGYYGEIEKITFSFELFCECLDCDYYFDYYTSVDSFEDCKSKCKWSCRSEFAISISLYFDCQQLSDAATFHTTLTRAAPSMATATSPMTAPTPSQHQGTGSVPPRSGNIFQKIRAMRIFSLDLQRTQGGREQDLLLLSIRCQNKHR